MTYFGAAEYFADSVESKMATRNSCQSFHNVPRGTLRPNVPRGTLRHFCLRRHPVGITGGEDDPICSFGEQCSTWNTRLVFKRVAKPRNVPRGTLPRLKTRAAHLRVFQSYLPLQALLSSKRMLNLAKVSVVGPLLQS